MLARDQACHEKLLHDYGWRIGIEVPPAVVEGRLSNFIDTVSLLSSEECALLVAIIVIALVNRKRDAVACWVLMAIGALTTANVVIATVWR